MDLEKLKSDLQAKIDSNEQDIAKLQENKVIVRLAELKEENLKRIEELQMIERLELIPNIDALLEKVTVPIPGSENIGVEKPPKTHTTPM